MLAIILVALTLYLFWLLLRNEPAFVADRTVSKRGIGPTADRDAWLGYCAEVFVPFSSQTAFYAIAYFTSFVAAANALSWSLVYEDNVALVISRFGSHFIISTYDTLLAAGFIALASFIIFWQLALYFASLLSRLLVRVLMITRLKFIAISFVFCSYFSYLLTISIFWLFHSQYSLWTGLQQTPVFLILALMLAIALPSSRAGSSNQGE
ncbi:hypothetical protein [Vibrio sp. CAU 1672]|uniref:hypothetical protein n=1 Tax=Vibrio sp. CAU 1672 TaxID=3032594 RepID=UPI0023DC2E58|nr:hypothetical protein [Vibrio sp. CAU 1672]MDF2153392.1 hypothetical protein [Vibrio sp. CAU 1672]